MTEDKPPPSPEELEARLREARRGAGLDPDPGKPGMGVGQGYGQGVRIGIELVAGVVVGLFLGITVDNWLGTSPWGVVVFFLLGAGAGFMNVYRAVTGKGYAIGYRKDPARGSAEDGPSGPGR